MDPTFFDTYKTNIQTYKKLVDSVNSIGWIINNRPDIVERYEMNLDSTLSDLRLAISNFEGENLDLLTSFGG